MGNVVLPSRLSSQVQYGAQPLGSGLIVSERYCVSSIGHGGRSN
jgi:hypothetical protein